MRITASHVVTVIESDSGRTVVIEIRHDSPSLVYCRRKDGSVDYSAQYQADDWDFLWMFLDKTGEEIGIPDLSEIVHDVLTFQLPEYPVSGVSYLDSMN